MDMTHWKEKARNKASEVSLRIKYFFASEYSPRGLAILFILALGTGAGIKSLANDSLTIGFDDYRLSQSRNTIDLNTLQKELVRRGDSLAASLEGVPQGEVCAEEEK